MDLNARLPKGYRTRPFEDADREPIVAAGNAESHPMEAESAEEWRRWERMMEDPQRIRVSVTGSDGKIAATGAIQVGMMQRPDGSQQIGLTVFKEHRHRGLGSAILETLESEARRRRVPRLLAGASAAKPFALEFATKRGYREIGRRIMSYRELASYEPAHWRKSLDRVATTGIRIRSFSEVLAERDAEGKERFWHELYEAEAPMWDDIPFATPTPHWPFERFHTMAVKSGQMLAGMTGVARDHRGKGIAMALKVEALARAKAKGRRAMGTVNDESNKAMRGVNIKLGYTPVPDHVELAKTIGPSAGVR